MHHDVETLRELDQGQALRMTLADGTVVEARVNQFEYAPNERVRVEFSIDTAGDRCRYQAFATPDGGEWSALEVRRFDDERDGWTELGEVADVTALDATQFRESEDDPGGRR